VCDEDAFARGRRYPLYQCELGASNVGRGRAGVRSGHDGLESRVAQPENRAGRRRGCFGVGVQVVVRCGGPVSARDRPVLARDRRGADLVRAKIRG
jgi:hypothetical protein